MLILSACNEAGGGDPAKADSAGIGNLPSLKRDGKEFPYIRYVEKSAGSNLGRAVFLHPMMKKRNEVLVLEYSPLTDEGRMEALFGEELLGGGGRVSAEGNDVRIEFLPISLPIGVAAGREWTLSYAKQDFTCRSRLAEGAGNSAGRLAVTCSGERHTLGFVFSRDRGVEEFQDFCDASVCTFTLIDGEGLLSDEVLTHMGLPRI